MTQRVVYGRGDSMIEWAEARIGLEPFSNHARAIGSQSDGVLTAVVVFDRFTAWGCEVSVATEGRRWFSRTFMVSVASYAFVQLRLERLTCHIEAKNRRSIIFALAVGFREEGRLRRLNPENDVRIFGMLRHECRYAPSPIMRL